MGHNGGWHRVAGRAWWEMEYSQRQNNGREHGEMGVKENGHGTWLCDRHMYPEKEPTADQSNDCTEVVWWVNWGYYGNECGSGVT